MRYALLCVLFTVLLTSAPVYVRCQPASSVVINPVSIEDDVDAMGAIDLWSCLNQGEMVQVECGPYNAKSLDVVLTGEVVEIGSTGELNVTISVNVTMASDLPADASFTLEIALDADLDLTTGKSSPSCFYNGIGADWDVGVEVMGGEVTSRWIEGYGSEGWSKVGEPAVELGPTSVRVDLMRSQIGDPKSVRFMAYVIAGGAADMVPNFGDEFPEFSFSFPLWPGWRSPHRSPRAPNSS